MKQLDEMERMARAMLDLRTGSYEHAPDIARALLAVIPVVRLAEKYAIAEIAAPDVVAAIDELRRRLGGE